VPCNRVLGGGYVAVEGTLRSRLNFMRFFQKFIFRFFRLQCVREVEDFVRTLERSLCRTGIHLQATWLVSSFTDFR
jgi:hypothetical protein